MNIRDNLTLNWNSILQAVIDGTQNTISNLSLSNFTPGTVITDLAAFSGTLHTSVASAKAIKDYLNSIAAGTSLDMGSWSAVSGVLPTTGSGPNGSILKSNFWHVTGAGTVPGLGDLQIGDLIYASVAGATTASQFFAVQGNVAQATETVLGLVMLATEAEAQLKTSTKVVTAAALAYFIRGRSVAVTTDGVNTVHLVTHNLNTPLSQLQISCRDTTTGDEFFPRLEQVTVNQIQITSTPAHPAGGYTVNIQGL